MKLERGSIKHLVLSIIITNIMGFIIFPLLDFILSLFTSKTFEYSVKNYIIEPIIICTSVSVILWIVDRRKGKKK